MYVNLTHPVHNSMTITFPRPSWSSSMASNFTIFSWFTFCNTSNSRICTSTGRIWDIWLNVLTATGSPLCLFTPYIQTDTNKTIAQCEWWKSKGWTTMAGFEMPYFAIYKLPEKPLRWLLCPKLMSYTRRNWSNRVRMTWCEFRCGLNTFSK